MLVLFVRAQCVLLNERIYDDAMFGEPWFADCVLWGVGGAREEEARRRRSSVGGAGSVVDDAAAPLLKSGDERTLFCQIPLPPPLAPTTQEG